MAKRNTTGKQRVMRTDEEKKQLVIEYFSLPPGDGAAWLRKNKLSTSMIHRANRDLGLNYEPKTHAGRPHALRAAAASDSAPDASPAMRFKDYGPDAKRQLIKQYYRISKEDRQVFQKQHSVSEPMIWYWNGKLRRAKNVPKKIEQPISPPEQSSAPANGPKRFSDEQEDAMIAEYLGLSGNGYKSEWLRTRGLTHQTIFTMKQRVLARQGNNGHTPTKAVAIRKQTIPTPRVDQAAYTHIPVAEPEHRPALFLTDGINYLTVKRDIYNEVIEDLKRVLAGTR